VQALWGCHGLPVAPGRSMAQSNGTPTYGFPNNRSHRSGPQLPQSLALTAVEALQTTAQRATTCCLYQQLSDTDLRWGCGGLVNTARQNAPYSARNQGARCERIVLYIGLQRWDKKEGAGRTQPVYIRGYPLHHWRYEAFLRHAKQTVHAKALLAHTRSSKVTVRCPVMLVGASERP
jgi:hypothetical protein